MPSMSRGYLCAQRYIHAYNPRSKKRTKRISRGKAEPDHTLQYAMLIKDSNVIFFRCYTFANLDTNIHARIRTAASRS